MKVGGLELPLDPHQVEGIAHLLRRPASGIFGDPGTGKTLTTLSAFHLLKRKGIIDALIVLAPLNPTYEVWPLEVPKWHFPYEVAILHGPKKMQAALSGADIFVLNYDGLDWFVREAWPKMRGTRRWWLVGDESTKYRKTNTIRFKRLKSMLNDFDRRTPLTGTPTPKSYLDLFGQVYMMDLGETLGKYITQYRREYFFQTGYGGYTWALQDKADKRIMDALGGSMYRVSDKVLGLKKPRYNDIWVTLPPNARATYEEFEREFITKIGRTKLTAVNAGVLSGKLRQLANGFVYDAKGKAHNVHDGKLEVVNDLVEQLQGSPLLLGYEFDHDGERLSKLLDAPRVYGGTKRAEAKKLFAQFNDGTLPVLACQSAAAAHGLNLQQACHTVGYFGLPWDLETYIQFMRRVQRKGQTRRVTVHSFLARDTVDTLSLEVLTAKNVRQDHFLAGIKRRYLK